jgi:tetrapyrrole methylase family protein / MazG family protein
MSPRPKRAPTAPPVAATPAGITVVGLGPGRWEDLTIAACETLAAAPRVLCRTTRHPTVDELRARHPAVALDAFDALYDGAQSFDALYDTMVERLLALATAPDASAIVYAVPGHPLIGEESVRRLRARAADLGVPVRIVPGMSFVEPVCATLGIDPLERHLQLLDGTLLGDLDPAAVMGAILPTEPALVAQVYNRRVASAVKLALAEVYPDDWEVAVVRSAGLGVEETVERVPLYELDRGQRADHLTTLYVPPLAPLAALRVPEGLRYIVARLRAPDGCPWDRAQTHESLRRYVLEEAYEVADVLAEWEGTPEQADHLAEELGDLLLQVYLQAEVAHGEGLFHVGDVFAAINAKLIRRHPHVFGDVTVRDADHVIQNWEAIKRAERAAAGHDPVAASALAGVLHSAPALHQAHELSRKAAKVGFEWPEMADALVKVGEEARELAAAQAGGDQAGMAAELGDLLFALAVVARRLGIEPEDALRAANTRFRRRFAAMEARARADHRALDALTPADWLALWAAAKADAADEGQSRRSRP